MSRPPVDPQTESVTTAWPLNWLRGLLALSCVVMFGFDLGGVPLTSPNEGLYAQVAREMLQRGDYIVPRINGLLYFEKPPLLYWLVALCMRLFGDVAWAARLPSVGAGLATVLLIWWLGTKILGRAGGLLSAIIAATGIGFVLMARQVMFDALLTACITLTMASFWLATLEPSKSARSRWLIHLAYLGLALAILAKGFLGLLPLLAILLYAALGRDWRRLRPLVNPISWVLFLIVVLPWHLMVAHRVPDWTWYYFVNEHLYRLLGKRVPADFHVGAVYLPAAGLLLLLLPWSLLVAPLLRFARESFRRPDLDRASLLYLHCWLWLPLAIFTFSKTRALYYVLPVMPPLALLLGLWWRDLPAQWERAPVRRWVMAPQLLFVLACLAVCVVTLVSARKHPGTIHPRTVLAMSAGVWLLAGSLLTACGLARKRFLFAFGAQVLAVLATCICTLTLAARTGAATTEDSLARIVALGPQPPHLAVAMEKHFEDHSAFAFYLPPRVFPIYIVDGRYGGDLQYGSKGNPGLFQSPAQFADFAGHRPVYYLTHNPPSLPLPLGFHLAGREEASELWSNFGPTGIAVALLRSLPAVRHK